MVLCISRDNSEIITHKITRRQSRAACGENWCQIILLIWSGEQGIALSSIQMTYLYIFLITIENSGRKEPKVLFSSRPFTMHIVFPPKWRISLFFFISCFVIWHMVLLLHIFQNHNILPSTHWEELKAGFQREMGVSTITAERQNSQKVEATQMSINGWMHQWNAVCSRKSAWS